MKKTEPPIIVSEVYQASKENVWNAITDLKEMKLWFFETIDAFQPKVGAKSNFTIENQGRTFTHQWEVMEVIPFAKIKYKWDYKEWQGDSYVEFELKEIENRTELILKAVVLEDFPDDIPEFKRESAVAGWEYFIKGRLKEYLES